MEALLKKLNYKEGYVPYLRGADSLRDELFAELQVPEDPDAIDFALIFVHNVEQVKLGIEEIEPRLNEDAVLWFSYVKKSSKAFEGKITRDSGWESLGTFSYEPVRQVSINEDWSALRFRKLKHIKQLTRRQSMRLSK